MYVMGMKRNEIKHFDTIQSCVSAMIENGYRCRTIAFVEGDTMFTQKISIDEEGKATIGKKKVEKLL